MKRTRKKVIKVGVTITPPQRDRLKDISISTGLTVSELIRRAIDSKYPYENTEQTN